MGLLVDDLLLLARLDQGRPLERFTVDLGRGRRRRRRGGRAVRRGPAHLPRRRRAACSSTATPPACARSSTTSCATPLSTRRRRTPVHVAVRPRGSTAPCITVADEGPGLDADQAGQRVRPLLPGQRGPHRRGHRARAVDRGRPGGGPRRRGPGRRSARGGRGVHRGAARPSTRSPSDPPGAAPAGPTPGPPAAGDGRTRRSPR